jgi:predicted aldo/keto reductase-like oxidoreductase
MRYTILGKTGLKVSFLGFGGIPIQRVSRQEAAVTVRRCLELGICFIDTARGYTDSEEKIGEALAGVPRDSYVLATKTLSRSGQDMARDIDLSLKNLGVEHIDLYQCHNVRFDKDEAALFAPGGGLEALSEAKKAGKIGHIGLTGHQVDRLVRLMKTGRFETVQAPYNFNEDKPEKELLPLAAAENMGVIVMKPLGGGALPQDLALRFFLDKPVSVVIPGMESPAMADQNLHSLMAGGPLSAEEQGEILELRRQLGQRYCRRCDYCQPCPQQIDISFIFLLHAYCTRYNMKAWALKRYDGLKVKGDACVRCGQCAGRCPYGLPVPEMIAEAAADMRPES